MTAGCWLVGIAALATFRKNVKQRLPIPQTPSVGFCRFSMLIYYFILF